MSVVGEALGFGLGAVGSIFGGISASKAMKKVKSNIEKQQRENLDWYNRHYNEDATQLADAQAMLTKSREEFLDRNRAAAGSAAVMGGTEESVAASKAANAQAMADATSQIALSGQRRKDSVESQFQSKKDALQSELNDMERQKAGAISQAVQGVAEAGTNIADLF